MLKFAIILAAVAVCYVQAENKYYLYIRDVADVPELLPADGSDEGSLDKDHETIILVHGHGGSDKDEFNRQILTELLKPDIPEPYNIIVVNWPEAKNSYAMASAVVPNVAIRLQTFIQGLKTQVPAFQIATIHMVGFGLGAHIVGIAARGLETEIGRIGRITGLDPSGSGFGSNDQRLSISDASYVEVIHTDGSGIWANGIGTAIGQVNFYANGGSNQPGCFSHSCSHNRAYELFAASIYNPRLLGNPCRSLTQMNLNTCRGHSVPMGGLALVKTRDSNIYRINTGRSAPF